ncbi:hypothetical protein J2S43_008140 [Catenuloplanes nepalensis]|uniref:Uncharacterized protein n=1 Tax=Catenuloplanes nepalensis TaxID=587533 RepID=A0ABT9N7F8_9ACTN|nr:hypothetical protein [Catenuloplanes nepalensis]MDP9799628.1 hypothetical protein [Catenuloplanes nepalensis]
MNDEADLARLAAVTVTVAPGRDLDAITLVAAWRAHVATFEGDLTGGARDHVAALCFRDWIAQVSALLPADLRHRYDRTVAVIDARFKAVTEPDVDGLVERAADFPDSMHDWWWFRIPRTGPVRDDLMSG